MEEPIQLTTSNEGVIKYSDDVLCLLAALTACDVKGIAGMSSTLSDGIANLLNIKTEAEGVKLHREEGDILRFDLHIVVQYGYRIPDIALRLQEHIKTTIEEQTGLSVAAVNVFVQGIVFDTSHPMDKKEGHTDGR